MKMMLDTTPRSVGGWSSSSRYTQVKKRVYTRIALKIDS